MKKSRKPPRKDAKQRFTKAALGRKLGISRATVQKYLLRDGAPQPDKKGLYDRAEVASYIAEHASARVEGTELSELRALRLRLETEEMEMDLRKKRGETILKSEIAPAIAAFNAELTSNLRQKFEVELPSRYKGKGLVECQQINAEAIDWVLGRLKAGEWALGL